MPNETKPHDTNSADCWCGPDVLQICRECDGNGWTLAFGDDGIECWKCEGRGLEPVYDYSLPAVIVHQGDTATFTNVPWKEDE